MAESLMKMANLILPAATVKVRSLESIHSLIEVINYASLLIHSV